MFDFFSKFKPKSKDERIPKREDVPFKKGHEPIPPPKPEPPPEPEPKPEPPPEPEEPAPSEND